MSVRRSWTRRARVRCRRDRRAGRAEHTIVFHWWEKSKSGKFKFEGWPSYHLESVGDGTTLVRHRATLVPYGVWRLGTPILRRLAVKSGPPRWMRSRRPSRSKASTTPSCAASTPTSSPPGQRREGHVVVGRCLILQACEQRASCLVTHHYVFLPTPALGDSAPRNEGAVRAACGVIPITTRS